MRTTQSPDDLTGQVNIGNPAEFTMLELAELVSLPADDPKQRQPYITLAKRILDWAPRVSLEDGLKDTIGYFRELHRA